MRKETENIEVLDWEKIASYISEDMTDQDREVFELRIDKDEAYQHVIADERKFSNDGLLAADDNTLAWEKLASKINTWEKEESLSNSKPKQVHKLLYRVAAVVFALITLTVALYYASENTSNTELVFAVSINEQNKSVTLSDGTIVELNGGSKLYYTESLGKKERKVRFEGEGFFNVTKNANRPFIIETKNAKIAVLGTSFNVFSTSIKTEVLVSTGMVQLSKLNDNSTHVLLEKGDLGTFEHNSAFKKKIDNKNYLSWKTQKMVFKQTPLSEVLHVIEKTYNIEISQSDSVDEELLLTSTFDQEPLNIILESIGKTFNLTYSTNGREIAFSPK